MSAAQSQYVVRRDQRAHGAPLLVTLHGTGGTEDQLHEVGRELMPGAQVVSPRGDVDENGALRYFRRTGEGVYDMDDLARAVAKLGNFLQAERAAAGAPRVIGVGYSNGANVLAATAFVRPEVADDLILLHPLIPFTPAPQPGLAGRRVLIAAGENDPICPAPLTRALADWLRAQGAQVEEHWHPGGHEIERSELEAARRFLA